jgi:hypothetical protein
MRHSLWGAGARRRWCELGHRGSHRSTPGFAATDRVRDQLVRDGRLHRRRQSAESGAAGPRGAPAHTDRRRRHRPWCRRHARPIRWSASTRRSPRDRPSGTSTSWPPTVHDNDALDDPWPLSRTLNAGGRLVVCTRGAKGAIAVDANGLEHAVDAVPVGTMIDSNGAGDAFTAGLIHGLVDRGWRLDRALRAAAIAGATAVMSRSLASDRLTAGLLETA